MVDREVSFYKLFFNGGKQQDGFLLDEIRNEINHQYGNSIKKILPIKYHDKKINVTVEKLFDISSDKISFFKDFKSYYHAMINRFDTLEFIPSGRKINVILTNDRVRQGDKNTYVAKSNLFKYFKIYSKTLRREYNKEVWNKMEQEAIIAFYYVVSGYYFGKCPQYISKSIFEKLIKNTIPSDSLIFKYYHLNKDGSKYERQSKPKMDFKIKNKILREILPIILFLFATEDYKGAYFRRTKKGKW